MARYRMIYSLFSLLIVISGCSSYYKALSPAVVDDACIDSVRPIGIATAWFDASVDVVGHHISGLLLIKTMPDQSRRIVFTNEVGVTFFDFEFDDGGTFEVKRIIRQLDRKPVIETLKKDFFLLLAFPFRGDLQVWRMDEETYVGAVNESERWYFVTTADCSTLQGLELGSGRKRKVLITLSGADMENPVQIAIRHFTFDMSINLARIEKNADQ